jgi:hypothetical protein
MTDMLARTPAALKKRRYRRRLRDGLVVLRVEVAECELAEAMIAAGRLSPGAAVDRSELEAAAAAVLTEWAARWLRKP